MILPTDSEDCFLRIAVMVVTSSGSDVPIAIIVAAITESGTPIMTASAEPLSISSCAPRTIAAAPRMNLPMFIATLLPSVLGRSSGASLPCSRFAARMLSTINPTKTSMIIMLSETDSALSRVNANSSTTAASSRPALTPNCLRVI